LVNWLRDLCSCVCIRDPLVYYTEIKKELKFKFDMYSFSQLFCEIEKEKAEKRKKKITKKRTKRTKK